MSKPSEQYDWSQHSTSEEQGVGDNAMARLSALAQEQVEVEAQIATLEAQLKDAKAALKDVREKRLPELMDDLGLTEFKTATGTKIKVGEHIRGGIPADNQEKAFAYLEGEGDGNLIKRQFVIEFGKGDEAWAKKFSRDLAQRKKKVNSKVKRAVHPQSLYAYVKQKLEEGVDFPMELFGVFRQRITKVEITE